MLVTNVMVRLTPERFPPRTVKKLHARSAWPFRIRARINSNIYVMDFSSDFCI